MRTAHHAALTADSATVTPVSMTRKRGIVAFLFAALLATLAFTAAGAPAQAANPYVKIHHYSFSGPGPSGYCLDIQTQNNVYAQVWSCGGASGWQENLVSGTSYFQFYSQSAGNCLGISGGSTSAGALAVAKPCTTGDTDWSVYYANNAGFGWYQVLQNAQTGLCLNLLNNHLANGGVVEQEPCAVIQSELWDL